MTGGTESAGSSATGPGNDTDAEPMPRPTYAPAAMAFGVTFLLWGFVASPVVLGAGAVLVAASLVGWIGEMCHEQ